MISSGMRRLIGRTALTILFAMGLAAGIAGVATPAFADAQCVTKRWATPPSTTTNTGGVKCILTLTTDVQARVWCGNTIFPPRLGPWVTVSDRWSSVNCGSTKAVLVKWWVR